MPEGQVLEFSGVTKRFGGVTAVDGFTARVEPGSVTGFLGPNGAGKTTTLRILLGLVRATEGRATIGGVPYAKLRDPLRTVGAVLEASSFHPGRTGAGHLKVYARAAGLPDSRVDEALGTVGLADVGGRKVGGYSLGMRQRLGLAYALLGDPGVLVLDEPSNGLDPEGIKWMRGLLRELARQGRTVLISSHLLAEVQQTVDSLVVISRGRLVFQGSLGDLTDPSEYTTVVDSADRAGLATALRDADLDTEVLRSGLVVRGVDTATVGAAAAAGGIALTLLQRRGPALEEIFLDLVNGTRVHASASGQAAPAVDAPVADVTEDAPVAEEIAAPEAQAVAGAPGGDEAAASETAEIAASATEPAGEAPEDVVSDGPEVDSADPASPDAAVGGDVAAEPIAEDPEHADAEATAELAHAGFVVASTGIIDVIPSASEDGAREDGAAADGAAAEESVPEVDVTPAADEAPRQEASHGVFSVGATGETVETATIDIVGVDTPEDAPAGDDAPADDEVSEASDRPWETYVKTESDRDADRFFAGFTADDGPEAGQETGPETEAGHEPDQGETLAAAAPSGEDDADDRDADEREGGEHR